eukprot:COSAG01_NODE_29805_length_629_cov_0.733962_2_plen_43_part_01
MPLPCPASARMHALGGALSFRHRGIPTHMNSGGRLLTQSVCVI